MIIINIIIIIIIIINIISIIIIIGRKENEKLLLQLSTLSS